MPWKGGRGSSVFEVFRPIASSPSSVPHTPSLPLSFVIRLRGGVTKESSIFARSKGSRALSPSLFQSSMRLSICSLTPDLPPGTSWGLVYFPSSCVCLFSFLLFLGVVRACSFLPPHGRSSCSSPFRLHLSIVKKETLVSFPGKEGGFFSLFAFTLGAKKRRRKDVVPEGRPEGRCERAVLEHRVESEHGRCCGSG